MRVLMTTDTVGGVWTYTSELTGQLLNRGCAVALVSFGRPPSAAQRRWAQEIALRYGESFRYVASTVPLEWMPANHSSFTGGLQILLPLARKFGADLLHSNQFCYGCLDLGIPRLVVAHSDVLSWSACCGRPLEAGAWLTRYRALIQAGLIGADAVVTPTAWMLRALGENFFLPRNCTVIANGRSIMAECPDGPRNLQAIAAGRFWDEGKNLRLLSSVRSPIPILVAGEIRFDCESNGPRAATESSGEAILLGPLEQPELLRLFRQSALYLCTSVYEPFGLAPLEAASSGCAVVANDIPSLRELWEGAAFFFDGAGELSRLLSFLASHPEDLLLGRYRASQRAMQFGAARMAESYLALYHSLRRRNSFPALEASVHAA